MSSSFVSFEKNHTVKKDFWWFGVKCGKMLSRLLNWTGKSVMDNDGKRIVWDVRDHNLYIIHMWYLPLSYLTMTTTSTTMITTTTIKMTTTSMTMITVNSEHRHAREKPWLSTIVEVSPLLLLNCIGSQRLGNILNYLVCHTKPIIATPTAPMGSKTGVEGSIWACPDSVPASKMQV